MATVSKDRRTSPRHPAQPEQMVVFDIKGYPVYQLKLQDVSKAGVGVIVRHDSKLLALIQVDQQLTMRVLSPKDSRVVQDVYEVRITHISESKEGRFKGHMVVGTELLHEDD